jgi:hypothetical protein
LYSADAGVATHEAISAAAATPQISFFIVSLPVLIVASEEFSNIGHAELLLFNMGHVA